MWCLNHFYWELRVTARKWKGFMCSIVLTQFVYLLNMAKYKLNSVLIKLKILSVRILIKLTTLLWLLRSSVGDFNVKRGFFVQIKLSLYNTDVSDCTVKNTIPILNILSAIPKIRNYVVNIKIWVCWSKPNFL